jgi:hypothetical protein
MIMFNGVIDGRMLVGLFVYCNGDYARKVDRVSAGLLGLLANDTKNDEKSLSLSLSIYIYKETIWFRCNKKFYFPEKVEKKINVWKWIMYF